MGADIVYEYLTVGMAQVSVPFGSHIVKIDIRDKWAAAGSMSMSTPYPFYEEPAIHIYRNGYDVTDKYIKRNGKDIPPTGDNLLMVFDIVTQVEWKESQANKKEGATDEQKEQTKEKTA